MEINLQSKLNNKNNNKLIFFISCSLVLVSTRPFDNRFTYYSKNRGVIIRPGYKIMKHILEIQNNIALITTRLSKTDRFSHAFVTSKISESSIIPLGYVFPIYIQEDSETPERVKKENFKNKFRHFLDVKYNKKFTAEEILGYIYTILYSNIYRDRFYEHLQIDFPKIIFVDNADIFVTLGKLGTDLINSHLVKVVPTININIGKCFSFLDETLKQNSIIEKVFYKEETNELYYNQTSRFINVSKKVYNYTIGSCQTLKSYLTYRKGREMPSKEVEHLEKVIKTIHYTIGIQKK